VEVSISLVKKLREAIWAAILRLHDSESQEKGKEEEEEESQK
jgi:hypothetical protein